jgi:hypothetical protein
MAVVFLSTFSDFLGRVPRKVEVITRLKTLIVFWEVEAPAETCFYEVMFRQEP